jgi:hypothetical protein
MGWFSNIYYPFVSLFSFPLPIHKIPIIMDNIFPYQGIAKRKQAKLAKSCLPSELIEPSGSGV